jgi:hypothetical protein
MDAETIDVTPTESSDAEAEPEPTPDGGSEHQAGGDSET